MAHATGLRLLGAICFLLSATLILAPITLPLAFGFYYLARKKEKEREKELELLEKHADRGK